MGYSYDQLAEAFGKPTVGAARKAAQRRQSAGWLYVFTGLSDPSPANHRA